MKAEKQTVYLPVKAEDELPDKNYSDGLHSNCGLVGFENGVFGRWDNSKGIWNHPIKVKTWLKEQKSFVFTSEQLNEYTKNVIKCALDNAAKNADLTVHKKSQYSEKAKWKKVSRKEAEAGVDLFSYEVQYKPSKKSITNTFEETFKKYKV